MKKNDTMSYYSVRFPIDWDTRIAALRDKMEVDRPAEVLSVSYSTVVRQAFRIGVDKLVAKYGEENGR